MGDPIGDFDVEEHIEIHRRSMCKIQCFIPWTLQVNWVVNQSGDELNGQLGLTLDLNKGLGELTENAGAE